MMGIPTYSVQPSLPLLCSRYMRLAPLLSLLVAPLFLSFPSRPPPASFLSYPPLSMSFPFSLPAIGEATCVNSTPGPDLESPGLSQVRKPKSSESRPVLQSKHDL